MTDKIVTMTEKELKSLIVEGVVATLNAMRTTNQLDIKVKLRVSENARHHTPNFVTGVEVDDATLGGRVYGFNVPCNVKF